tara:strand:+ start:187 stop:603 length:417 start_codon:yes stop_codon:yes gene_type:complete
MQDYNHLVQTNKIEPVEFEFTHEECGMWTCSIYEPLGAECTALNKQKAKRGVCEEICRWYRDQHSKTHENSVMREYHDLVETGKIEPVAFTVSYDGEYWTYSMTRPINTSYAARNQQEAKRGACGYICDWYKSKMTNE